MSADAMANQLTLSALSGCAGEPLGLTLSALSGCAGEPLGLGDIDR